MHSGNVNFRPVINIFSSFSNDAEIVKKYFFEDHRVNIEQKTQIWTYHSNNINIFLFEDLYLKLLRKRTLSRSRLSDTFQRSSKTFKFICIFAPHLSSCHFCTLARVYGIKFVTMFVAPSRKWRRPYKRFI